MWYYSINGQTSSPMSEAELDALVKNGTLAPDTYVWKEGMAGWKPYYEARDGSSPPPLPARPPAAAAPASGSGMKLRQDAHAGPPVVGGGLTIQREATPATNTPAVVMVGREQVVITPDGEPAPGVAPRPVSAGTAKMEEFSAWGMVVLLVVAMFVFGGVVLRHRPATTRAAAEDTGPRSSGAPDARVSVSKSSLVIRNLNSYDWPATTVEVVNAEGQYTYQLSGLSQNETARIPLSNFQNAAGKTLSGMNAKPRMVRLKVAGRGVVSFGS